MTTSATPALMLLGTHSNAGKSLMAAAFCRLLARRGYRVAPFKAQNMSNNAGVTPEGGEIGRAQVVQAAAAGIEPHTDMNPLLLKPEADRRSQIVLNGRVHGHIDARNWRQLRRTLWDEVRAAYDRLASRYEVVVLEGAGSPAEINLKEADIVNLRMARHAQAACLLVGDIDRGGVFAALAGTMLLLEPEERRQIKAFLINKFRGDPALLGSVCEDLREKAFGVPTLGVVPFVQDLRIADEDAVPLEDGAAAGDYEVDIAVVQLPHIANFDDFDPLRRHPGVRLRYVRFADELGRPQAVVLPGSKATMSDLAWLRQAGWEGPLRAARANGAQVVGVCGGFQMLGRGLSDPEGFDGPAGGAAPGLGFLPVETRFVADKETNRVVAARAGGLRLSGYEIHLGATRRDPGCRPFAVLVERGGKEVRIEDGAEADDGLAWGTYIHGLFANDAFRRGWIGQLGGQSADRPYDAEAEYDRLADAVEGAVDWGAVERIVGL